MRIRRKPDGLEFFRDAPALHEQDNLYRGVSLSLPAPMQRMHGRPAPS